MTWARGSGLHPSQTLFGHEVHFGDEICTLCYRGDGVSPPENSCKYRCRSASPGVGVSLLEIFWQYRCTSVHIGAFLGGFWWNMHLWGMGSHLRTKISKIIGADLCNLIIYCHCCIRSADSDSNVTFVISKKWPFIVRVISLSYYLRVVIEWQQISAVFPMREE